MGRLQYSIELNNLALDTKINAIGGDVALKIFSGLQPRSCAAPDPEGLLCIIVLPELWMQSAEHGAAHGASLPWRGIVQETGTAASFRIANPDGDCHLQGSIGKGRGDLLLKETVLEVGQVLIIEAFTLAAANR